MLASAWDLNVHEAVFDILLSRKKMAQTSSTIVTCPYIVPAIFSALHRGLDAVAQRPQTSDTMDGESRTESKFMILKIR